MQMHLKTLRTLFYILIGWCILVVSNFSNNNGTYIRGYFVYYKWGGGVRKSIGHCLIPLDPWLLNVTFAGSGLFDILYDVHTEINGLIIYYYLDVAPDFNVH